MKSWKESRQNRYGFHGLILTIQSNYLMLYVSSPRDFSGIEISNNTFIMLENFPVFYTCQQNQVSWTPFEINSYYMQLKDEKLGRVSHTLLFFWIIKCTLNKTDVNHPVKSKSWVISRKGLQLFSSFFFYGLLGRQLCQNKSRKPKKHNYYFLSHYH